MTTNDEDGDNNNITWHPHLVSQCDRWKVSGHQGCVVWFTGLSGSGKSTIANEVDYDLNQRGIRTYLLDGDNIRHGLCKDLGFSPDDRAENIRRIAEVAKLMADSGVVVLAAFISPYREDRQKVRVTMGDLGLVEVFVKAELETCEGRDPKGLYQKARAGIIKNFTGIDDPYEPPLNPEIVLDSDSKTVPQLSIQVIEWLLAHGKLSV
jgi:adenylylsulfate kinase